MIYLKTNKKETKMKKMTLLITILCVSVLNGMENIPNYLAQQQSLFTKQYPSNKLDGQKWVGFVRMLYRGSSSTQGDMLALYVNKEDLPNSYLDLKELFNKYMINTCYFSDKWTDDTWKDTYSRLKEQKQKQEYIVNIRDIPVLLETAKSIVKAFLPDDNEMPTIINTFMEKLLRDESLNRLFTYTYLNLVILVKKLTHIKLPRKVVLIQNKKTKQYVSNQEAQRIIDDSLKVCVKKWPISTWYKEVNCQILFISDEYELKLFAHKELKNESFLSDIAITELKSLCEIAPFDIGGHIGQRNMFQDDDNAIIIDTEYLGEPATDACPKLERYR